MSFRQKTLDDALQRVGDLCRGFDKYTAAFDAAALFSGPSLYFHHRTLSIRRDLGGSVDACLGSEAFFESLYATLASWGLHRMGPGNTKLVDLPVLAQSFRSLSVNLRKLEGMKIEAISQRDVSRIADLIWPIIWDLKVGIGNTKIISGTKALHHLLPDLVPPIDREYTVQFLFKNKNAVQGDATKQRDAFRAMYPHFATISRTCGSQIASRLSRGMNTSVTKVIDNAIVGYGRVVLNLADEPEDDEG